VPTVVVASPEFPFSVANHSTCAVRTATPGLDRRFAPQRLGIRGKRLDAVCLSSFSSPVSQLLLMSWRQLLGLMPSWQSGDTGQVTDDGSEPDLTTVTRAIHLENDSMVPIQWESNPMVPVEETHYQQPMRRCRAPPFQSSQASLKCVPRKRLRCLGRAICPNRTSGPNRATHTNV